MLGYLMVFLRSIGFGVYGLGATDCGFRDVGLLFQGKYHPQPNVELLIIPFRKAIALFQESLVASLHMCSGEGISISRPPEQPNKQLTFQIRFRYIRLAEAIG